MQLQRIIVVMWGGGVGRIVCLQEVGLLVAGLLMLVVALLLSGLMLDSCATL